MFRHGRLVCNECMNPPDFYLRIKFSQCRIAEMGFITFTVFEITTVACFIIFGVEILIHFS